VVKTAEAKDAAVRTAALRLAVKLAGKERGKVTPALEKALKDADKSVRVAAAELLTAKGALTTADVPRLQEMLKHGDVEVRGAAAAGLTQLGTGAKEALPALLETVKDETLPAATRLACLKAASTAGADPKDLVPVLQKAARDNNMELRIAALDAVARLGPNASATLGGVIKALDDRESRKAALAALAAIGPGAAKEGIPQALRFIDDAELRPDVLTTLTALKPTGPDAAPLVTKLLEIVGDETKADVRAKEVALLAAVGKPAVQPLALAVDRNPNQHVRQAAAEALGQMGGAARDAVPLLTKAARADQVKEVREAATAAIVKIRK
jgi:HEAT repeat protein